MSDETHVNSIEREILDKEHLRLLAVFHYISGGMAVFFALLFFFYTALMSMIPVEDLNTSNVQVPGASPEQILGVISWLFGVLGTMSIIYGLLQIISGRFMIRRRHRIFSFIVAIPNIIFIPYGTLLAVFTLIVLDRTSVKDLYLTKSGATASAM